MVLVLLLVLLLVPPRFRLIGEESPLYGLLYGLQLGPRRPQTHKLISVVSNLLNSSVKNP